MSSLAKALLDREVTGTQILYGEATGNNTVTIAGSTVAVTLPALSPVVSGQYVAVLAAGADRLILGAVSTPWTALTLTNSWTNTSGFQTGQYRRVGDMVHLRGYLTAGTNGASAFTLPAGFRPPASFDVPVASYTGGSPAASAAHLFVQSTGTCPATVSTGLYVSFNFSFSVSAA